MEQQIIISLPGGDSRAFAAGITAAEVTRSLGAGLYKAACVARVDGHLTDLRTPLTGDCALEILTFDQEEGVEAFRHTAAHILAQAIKRLYPAAKLATGPAVDGGFYYDIDIDTPFTPEDTERLEAEMKRIVKEDLPIERFTLAKEDALQLMQKQDEPYKLLLIEEHAATGAALSFYQQGEFIDLCAGPHLMSTSAIRALKVTSTTGAYWKADARNKQLCRVYGTAFPKASLLEEHLLRLEEAAKRDHRRLGRELDLFDILDEGRGFPFFYPNGMILRNQLEDFWRQEHRKNGYQEIKTPIILNEELWHRSGHWDHYKDNMYTTSIDDTAHAIKPMNCPGGMLAYKRKLHSYKDLPQRIAELGLVHRHELSGALHGLMRVRCFTQDDAHIFMTPEQVEEEIKGVIALIDSFYQVFGFSYKLELSTRPENSMGSDEQWEKATKALQDALDSLGRDYKINEGDGAFYGPKIDFHLEDSIGRTWQCGTIQLDFQMPELFDLQYVGTDGEKHRPVMIHRVVFGSIERFIAILTEHYAGAFPLWLAPEQIRILPITDRQHEGANAVLEQLQAQGYRASVDLRSEKVGYKIREAQMHKVPFMLVIGDKELESGTVAVRSREQGDLGTMSLEDFVGQAGR